MELRRDFVEVRRLRDSFKSASSGPAGYEELMVRIDALQTRGFRLQDSAETGESDELYALLEEIEILRDEAVSLEPGTPDRSNDSRRSR